MPQPYYLSSEELRAVQMVELELLCEVDRICRKCNITYRIISGTLIGAVRHKGFIPWDDDADVGFLRCEYEQFREACKTELDTSRFYFQDHTVTPGYRWGYGKLRRKNTSFVRLGQEHMPYEQGIFIDLMPFDNIPDNYLLRCVHCFRSFLYRKCFWSEVGKYTSRGFLRFVYVLLNKITAKALYSGYDRFVERGNKKQTKRIRIIAFPVPSKEHGYLREWWTNTTEIVFEAHSFITVAKWHDYLTFKYKDYMRLPPEDKRKIHPVSELRVDR